MNRRCIKGGTFSSLIINQMSENTVVNSLRGSKEYGNDPESRIWKPIKIGDKTLKHRIAMAPLTRFRAIGGVPNDLHVEYYSQRATDGGLIITEGTIIAYEAGGAVNAPGIYSEEQIAAWRKVTDAVHAKGGIIYCQLWQLGRANPGQDPNVKVVSASTTPFEGGEVPEEMTTEDVQRYVQHFKHAAENAMKAGFDGVEVHAAHGYLLDQFIQAASNNTRTDQYGGSLENRARFVFEALDVVTQAVGQKRTSVRFSPFSQFQGQGKEADPFETYSYILREVVARFPKLSYVSITDPRDDALGGAAEYTSDPFRAIIRGITTPVSKYAKDATTVFPEPDENHPTVVLVAGGYKPSDATESGSRTGDIMAYGRTFIANPDLVKRIREGLELNAYDRNTFYTQDKVGYTTYPFADENTKVFRLPTPEVENAIVVKETAVVEKVVEEKLKTIKITIRVKSSQ
ncbi:hypothetical protein BC833DRAFT_598232 [Globomyces pollinis-pini]|nr:hypothetical protein BC833DRAFT_598232 [Globomyces pollinis-pini]